MRCARSLVVSALATLCVAGCAGGSAPATPRPADSPSDSARMVCEAEVQKDLGAAIGVSQRQVEPPTWSDHLYACRYDYDGGSLLLSVKELSSAAETASYLDGLARSLGNAQRLPGLGQSAFITSNGSVVVEKDWKVLLVDDSSLPAQLGNPPQKPPAVAYTVAKTILGCWTGV